MGVGKEQDGRRRRDGELRIRRAWRTTGRDLMTAAVVIKTRREIEI